MIQNFTKKLFEVMLYVNKNNFMKRILLVGSPLNEYETNFMEEYEVNVRSVLDRCVVNYSLESYSLENIPFSTIKQIENNFWDSVILWNPSFKPPIFLGWFHSSDRCHSMLVCSEEDGYMEKLGIGFSSGIKFCITDQQFLNSKDYFSNPSFTDNHRLLKKFDNLN
ncbi:hypothetical protein CL684_03195 [Candidatus Campbellbacteria bacterium]|nr:hypothetical protein [Candidatus Campbellbacteria bacterium]|tara:strand:+ start:194 stop:691 length:498 start_codon:yes stop_codon:yes gene_type:complete